MKKKRFEMRKIERIITQTHAVACSINYFAYQKTLHEEVSTDLAGKELQVFGDVPIRKRIAE